MNDLNSRILQKIERYLQTDIRYLIRGGGWVTIGQGLSILLSLGVAVSFANLVSKETYGTYKYILSIASIAAIPALAGMTTSILQTVARGNFGSYRTAIRQKITWGSFGSAALLFVGIYYYLIGENAVLGLSCLILAPFVPLIEAFGLWSSVYAGRKLFRESTILNSLVQIITSGATIITLLFSKSIPLLLFVYAVSYTLSRYLIHRHVLRKFPETKQFSDPERSLEHGKKLSLASIPATLLDQLEAILIWHFFGAASLGAYAFAIATTTPAKTFMKSMIYLGQPKFADTDAETLKRTVTRKVWKSFLFFVPATIAYIILLPYLYQIFFPRYLDTVAYAQVLGLIFLFFPGKLYSMAVTTRLDRRPTYIISSVIPIFNALSLVLLLYFFGVWGAVVSQIVDYATSLAATYYYFRKLKD